LPLAGASIVVTRPAGQATRLLAAVRALGGTAVALPGSRLGDIDDRDAARRALGSAIRVDDWIFASPAAVLFTFRLLPGWRPRRDARVFAPGAATRRSLARHGLVALAPVARQDSEGLLALPGLARLGGRSVGLVSAPGGRGLLGAELRRRGAQVQPIEVYRRLPPRLTRRHFDALATAPAPLAMLLSSGEALVRIAAMLPPQLLLRLRQQTLVVSSQRLAAAARVHAFADIVVAGSPAPRTLLDCAVGALARHRL
jgi:uroporphyrinogen-III synthase